MHPGRWDPACDLPCLRNKSNAQAAWGDANADTHPPSCIQTQADIIAIPVDRPAMREPTSLGPAIGR